MIEAYAVMNGQSKQVGDHYVLLLLVDRTGREQVNANVLTLFGEEVDHVQDRQVRPATLGIGVVEDGAVNVNGNVEGFHTLLLLISPHKVQRRT